MQLIHRLRLFPTVFEPPATQRDALGDGFGGPCLACIAAAAQLLAAWQPQVHRNHICAGNFCFTAIAADCTCAQHSGYT
jgi:hypothetical protein